jgi:hypothetical protein
MAEDVIIPAALSKVLMPGTYDGKERKGRIEKSPLWRLRMGVADHHILST